MIIGNSAAGLSAVEAIRKHDKDISITVISKEGGGAYSRVLLPYVLRGKLEYDNLFIRNKQYYEENNINYIEKLVTKIDEEKNTVLLDDKTVINYDKLLIATGSNPVKPPIEGINNEGIYHMWTKSDVDGLTKHFKAGKRVLVIGSGFVSLQAAWAAHCKGLEVKVVELASRVMTNVIDDEGAKLLTEKIKSFGVDLKTNTLTQKIEKQADGSLKVYLKDQEPMEVDFIIVGTGVRPNTSFLEDTKVIVNRGIEVDKNMRTNIENIYAAGDVACGPTTFGEEHVIHALWPTAIEMGKVAGLNMIDVNLDYEGSLNMNVTQMYDLTVGSMGRFSNDLQCETYIFPEERKKGYLKVCMVDGCVVGGCLVGSSDAVKILGKLRPIIRKKVKVDVHPEKLEMYLQMKAFNSRKIEI